MSAHIFNPHSSLSPPPSAFVQRRFDFADLGTGRPLCSVNAAMFILDLDEDAVLYRIQDGQLPYAFDISDAGCSREVRIWRGGLISIIKRLSVPDTITLEDVIREILPKHPGQTLRATELMRCLNCSSTHIHDLIRSGALAEDWRPDRGQTHTRYVPRISAVEFLRSRRFL